MALPALAIVGLVAAGLTATGTGLNLASLNKPYLDKKQGVIENTAWGDPLTAGTVSGIGAGVETDLSWNRWKVENPTARKFRTAGSIF